ncbi:MAG: helix-turn-helix transcriptional regulator [Gammaproteobacteria bacterium]|nr:helix-turn-helix transcriptional regulator [Gammaproteobacteria bacterium]
MTLRSLVREARKRRGLTQAALAQRAGVPQSTVSRVESGSRDLVEWLVRAAGFCPTRPQSAGPAAAWMTPSAPRRSSPHSRHRTYGRRYRLRCGNHS